MDDSKTNAVKKNSDLQTSNTETTTNEIGDSINVLAAAAAAAETKTKTTTNKADDLKAEKITTTTSATTTPTTNNDQVSIVEQIERRPSLLSTLSNNDAQATSPKEVNVIISKETPSTAATPAQTTDDNDTERNCWICFASDEDNRMAAWVQPCKCRGTTKWVHQSCLYRWIDEKQKGNALRSVSCQQCQTEYIIVFPNMGKLSNILESFDNLIKRLSPFLAAGIFVGSLYWTAVTYGAVTFLQIVGHKKGLALMDNGDPLILLLGLPAIPVGLVLGRMIRWEDAVIRLIRNRRSVARKFPLMNLIIPYPEEEEEPTTQNPATPTLSDPVSATRIFCGALLLPTISSIVGRVLFESIDNTLHRTLLGGLTFITVKGILKIYLKQQQYTRKKKRRIIDYTEENVRTYVNRNTNTTRQFGAAGAAGPAQRPQQNVRGFEGDFMV